MHAFWSTESIQPAGWLEVSLLDEHVQPLHIVVHFFYTSKLTLKHTVESL